MWIAEVHRTTHPESQSGSYPNVVPRVVSMLSPARRSRIGTMWVARTTGRLSNRTSLSLDDLQPGNRRALRESSWLPNLFGAKRQNHSSTVPKTGLRLVCSMRAKTCLYGHTQRPARTNEDIPHEGCRQNRLDIYRTPISFGQLQPGIVLSLFSGNHPTVDLFKDRIKISHTSVCSKRADQTLGGSTLGLPSGVLHESHKRADRTLGGSMFGSPFRRTP